MIEKPPPDFDKWRMVRQASMFSDETKKLPDHKTSVAGDPALDAWAGYIYKYSSPKSDQALGHGVDPFGNGVIAKGWGIKGEGDVFFSVLKDGQWITFSNRTHKLMLTWLCDKKRPERVSSCLARVYPRGSKEVKLAIRVERSD